jgi:hypothetical protein
VNRKNNKEKSRKTLFAKNLLTKRSLFPLFAFVALLLPPNLAAQNVPPSFLLPRTIFVGDEGRLVVMPGETFGGNNFANGEIVAGNFAGGNIIADVQPFVKENPADFGETFELQIRRIELERWAGVSRILIDFVPFVAGTIHFPTLYFHVSGQEPIALSGLRAEVASVLDGASMELSMPALPMAVPGTGLLIYGSMAVFLVTLALAVAISVWAKRRFKGFRLAMRRARLFRVMMRFLRRLGREGSTEKNGNPGYYLGLLAAEFRRFLSGFTGKNCRSLTPTEFMELPLAGETHQATALAPPQFADILTPAFLCRLFRNWDALRFNGFGVDKADFFQAVKETESFVLALRERERQNRRERPAAAGGKRP